MNNSPDFSAVIFDLDGTLLNTLEEIATSCNSALHRLGYPVHTVESYRRFVGNGASRLAWRALPHDRQTEENHERLLPLVLEELERHMNTLARPYQGVEEMLEEFVSAGKIISILSNKPEIFTRQTVARLLPEANFFSVRGGREDIPLKPAPDSALKLAADMGVTPEQTIFVGDSNVDMMTAVNADMLPVGVSWGFRGAEELREAGARLIVDRPEELNALLK